MALRSLARAQEAEALSWAENPIIRAMAALQSSQDERNRDVFEMAARIRDPEPDLGAPMLNNIPGGL